MTAPNRSTLWGRTFVDELAKAGVSGACIAPGSRSTPLVVAFAEHPDVRVFSHLDERSAAFFALGRGRRGAVTPVVSTSGTATANFHPAVIEADRGRAPLLVLTADRPPELRDSGANQTIDQEKLYGDAVRWYADLPEPEPDGRKLRALRTAAARALAAATGTPPGPVHLNVPFRKPLEPTAVPGDVPAEFADREPLGAEGRDGPFVEVAAGRPTLDAADLRRVVEAVRDADRGLIVAGPADPPTPSRDALADLARVTGAPVLADPLSGLRFGSHVESEEVVACGGYDSYLDGRVTGTWPDPDVVVRFGASPTSRTLRNYLRDADARQFLVDPAGGWREATFTATDLVVADPTRLAGALADELERDHGAAGAGPGWRERFREAEARYWELVPGDASAFFEGQVLADAAALAPDPATLFVSNSMPVRDLDRFGRPRAAEVTALGNRGASGIDGVVSTALGAGSATADPLVLVVGDLAYYHDTNGLLAIERCGGSEPDSGASRSPGDSDAMDATVVLVNNDGGGIFHMLPIEGHEAFAEFKTPHGLDFEPTADLYGLSFERVDSRAAFREAYRTSLASGGTQVVEVPFDAEASHRTRERLHERVVADLGG